ncbi:MAG: hypothetical protein KF764_29675 [Labilithrix sp.]|nr:hypothetical protein [Labilithrix sp.]MBX3220008.1 hypothetical protein [Labilithrix sp.]
MKRRAAALYVAALFVLAATTCSCGGDAPAAAAPKRASAPAWADAFDGTPDLYAVIRPQAMKRDGLYGAFFKALVRAAVARGIARGDTMVRAVEGAEEIIVGLNKGLDAALVLRGVPASLDPQKITDAEGHVLFRPKSDRARAVEYELYDRKSADAGALFVLPDRTWVGTLGGARERARQAFAAPRGRPVPEVDPDALVVVRVGGPLAHALDRHPVYGAVTQKLSSATFALKPGKGGLVVGLSYPDADATAWAEMHVKRLIDELAKDDVAAGRGGAAPAWLKDARVAYEGNTVVVRVAVPPRLLEELPSASGADFGF